MLDELGDLLVPSLENTLGLGRPCGSLSLDLDRLDDEETVIFLFDVMS